MKRSVSASQLKVLACAVALATAVPFRCVAASPGAANQHPLVAATGVVQVPAFRLPLSSYMSAPARAAFIRLFRDAPPGPDENSRARVLRSFDDRQNAPYVRRAEELWPVTIERRRIGGVWTRIVTPRAGVAAANKDRVLINLHGGGFIWGEGNGALVESIPIAGVAEIRVVTVDYREAPEHRFPAASEDVAAVYRALLKRYRPSDIGIYGSSAGGMLTAESIACFQKEHLPLPGAIGTFSGSADDFGGDAAYLSPLLIGQAPTRVRDVGTLNFTPYFKGASPSDPLVLPIASARVLSAFPPTLLIAGSRDFTVSSLFRVQAALSDAGVDAELHVWDGMWHVFFFDPSLPESRQVYRVVAKFFERHLGAGKAQNLVERRGLRPVAKVH